MENYVAITKKLLVKEIHLNNVYLNILDLHTRHFSFQNLAKPQSSLILYELKTSYLDLSVGKTIPPK